MRGNMGRRRFLGTAAAGVGAAAMGMSGTARAIGGDEPWEHKVYPTGNAELDVPAVQNAVNKSRTVILMSTTYSAHGRGSLQAFNFGARTVNITKDVTIIGRDAEIICEGPAFSCSRDIMLTVRGVFFNNALGSLHVIPISYVEGINVARLAIGGDEPWENKATFKVYPTGKPEDDYTNISEAVKSYRNVILMSTNDEGDLTAFDLTGEETIEIDSNVTIVGRGAKITPGIEPVFTCSSTNINLNIRGVFFEDTNNIPVNVEGAGGIGGINVTQLAIGGDEPWENPLPD